MSHPTLSQAKVPSDVQSLTALLVTVLQATAES